MQGENIMLQLTEAAGAQLHKSLTENHVPEHDGKCFRMVPKDERLLTLKLGKPAPSDSTLEYDGHVVLAVPKSIGPFVEDKNLDIDSDGNLKLY
jgi:hypothetical protein